VLLEQYFKMQSKIILPVSSTVDEVVPLSVAGCMRDS